MPVVAPAARPVGYVREGSKREACSKIRIPWHFGACSPHVEHVFDRPEVEAPRGVEPTGTNGRTRHTFRSACWVGSRPVVVSFVGWQGALFLVVTETIPVKRLVVRVRCPVPGPPRSESWLVPLPAAGSSGWPLYWFCGGHGPGETPGPFPNPEAKAWSRRWYCTREGVGE